MYRDETLDKYLNDVSSRSSTPGGGSVSALIGALSTCMASMSANFTLGKRGFEDVGPQIRGILERCKNDREELLRLMEDDIKAYQGVSKAYALPESNEVERQHRSSAIQDAFEKATAIPLRIVQCSLGLLEYISDLARIANPNLISDVGVGGLLANAALRGAMLNVEINLNYVKNQETINNATLEISRNLNRAEILINDIMDNVKKTIATKSVW